MTYTALSRGAPYPNMGEFNRRERKERRGKKSLFVLFVLFAVILPSVFAGPRGASVRLAWQDSDPTVTGYYIYSGVLSGTYSNAVDIGNVTNITIHGLAIGTTYYFAATAYNSNGLQSAFSSEVAYTPQAVTITNWVTFSAGPAFSMTLENPPDVLFGVVRSNGEVQLSLDLTNWVPIYNIGSPWYPMTITNALTR